MKGIGRVSAIVERIEEWLLAGAILLMALLTIANVVARTAFGTSLAFAEELSQFAIICVTFIGLSYSTSRGRHIRMTALYDQLGVRWRKRLMILITGSTAVLMLLLTWYALRYLSTVYQLGSVSPVLQVPLYLAYLAAPLGFVLTAIQYALALVRNLREDDVYLSDRKKDEYDPSPADGI